MTEPDSGAAPASRLRRWGLALLVAVAFVGIATVFAILMRPLAGDAPVAEVAAPQVAIAQQRPISAPLAAAPVEVAPPAVPTAAPLPFDGPRVAIVLTGLGADAVQTRVAIQKLPPEIGLAFSPYPDGSRTLADAARAAGHEVWAGIPMQPKSWPRVSPGANTLVVSASPAENRQRLAWALERIGPVAGVTSIMGSAFMESADALDPVLADLKTRGVAFLDSRVSGKSVGLVRARATGVPAMLNDRFLDEGGSTARNLAELEAAAKLNGSAVGFASPSPATVVAISAWAAKLDGKGLKLVPPSTLAK